MSDVNELAAAIVSEATSEESQPKDLYDGKDPLAMKLGRRGGRKGGLARARKLTPAQRSMAARKAAAARWGTPPKEEPIDYPEMLAWAQQELGEIRRQRSVLRRKAAALRQLIEGLTVVIADDASNGHAPPGGQSAAEGES